MTWLLLAALVVLGAAGVVLVGKLPRRLAGDLRLHQLAPGAYVYRGFFANSAALVLSDRVVVVDTQVTPAAARRLREGIAALTQKPITTVVNTHYHGDHAGGNGAFADCEIITSADTARFLVDRDHERVEYADTFGLEIDSVPPIPAPTRTFSRELVLGSGDDELRILQCGKVETSDACIVWWPARRVLVAGDGVATDSYPWLGVPFLDEGLHDDGEWLGYLDTLLSLDAEVLIGGHGEPIVGRQAVRARLELLRQLLSTLLETTRRELARGAALAEVIERVDAELAPFRRRPDLVERIVSQRFAIYRAINSLSPERRGRGWWHDLRPSVVRRAPVEAARRFRDAHRADLRAALTALARRDGPLAHATLDLLIAEGASAGLAAKSEGAWALGLLSDLCTDAAVRIRPVVDATEYVRLASHAAKEGLALSPSEPLAQVTLGVLKTWSALVVGETTGPGVALLEAALAGPNLTLRQRRKALFFLGKAAQMDGRAADADTWYRQLLPSAARFAYPLTRRVFWSLP